MGWYKCAQFNLYAKDSNCNVLINKNIKQQIDVIWNRWPEKVLFKEKLTLNEWIDAKKRLNIKGDELAWKAMFYFVNFMRDENDTDYYIDEAGFKLLCESEFLKTQYYEIGGELFEEYAIEKD
eukprot:735944_1